MNNVRRNVTFLVLLVIVVLLAFFARRLLSQPPCLLPPPFCGTSATSIPPPEPSPTVTRTVTITAIRAMAELATVEYQAVAEISNERVPDDIRGRLGVKEEILLIAYGDVKAGFDLSKLREGDLWTDGTRVQLHLPAPEILDSHVNRERTHVVYYRKSLLIAHDINLETDALQMAEEAITQAAMDAGILKKATDYGQLFFENFLRSLGFTEVRVIVD